MAEIVKGRDLILYSGLSADSLSAICHMRSCSLSIERDLIEKTPVNGPSNDYLYGFRGFTLSGDGITVYSDEVSIVDLQEYCWNGQFLFFKFTAFEIGGVAFSGKIALRSAVQNATYNDVALWSIEATGCGDLTISKLPITKQVYLSDLFGIQLAGCPNPYPLVVLWYDGTVIGAANNADDVMSLFNDYEGNQYYLLVGTDTGCNFTMNIDWDAPERPDWIPAEQGAGFVWGRSGQVGDNDILGRTGDLGDIDVYGPLTTA